METKGQLNAPVAFPPRKELQVPFHAVDSARCQQPIYSTQTKKRTVPFLTSRYYSITLNIRTCFSPRGVIIRESNQGNIAQKQTSSVYIRYKCKEIKRLKCKHRLQYSCVSAVGTGVRIVQYLGGCLRT
jgi:hypothetical protein